MKETLIPCLSLRHIGRLADPAELPVRPLLHGALVRARVAKNICDDFDFQQVIDGVRIELAAVEATRDLVDLRAILVLGL